MNIIVMNKSQAEDYSRTSHKDKSIIISITNHAFGSPLITPCNINGIIDVKFLKFNDTDSTERIYGGITEEDAVEISNFVKKYEKMPVIENIIVHCDAGQSRSAGVAAAIMKYMFNDDTPIFNNHKYKPNMLCYRRVLNALMIDDNWG